MNAREQLELAHVGRVGGVVGARGARLYFAFGSNLDLAQMARRCPGARAVEVASLPGFELAFAGYSPSWRGSVATVRERSRGSVRGLLYALDDRDFAALDRFEGHPSVYLRHYVWVRPRGARKLQRVETYLLDAELGEPSREYLEQIARAYRELGFPLAPLLSAARRCITEER